MHSIKAVGCLFTMGWCAVTASRKIANSIKFFQPFSMASTPESRLAGKLRRQAGFKACS